jgi:hypothetical protein
MVMVNNMMSIAKANISSILFYAWLLLMGLVFIFSCTVF